MRFLQVRFLRWFSLVVGALVALAVLAVLVIVWFVDPNSFKSNIESAVRDATGRELRLVGDIELGFFPWLALRAGEGHFANPPGFGSEHMVSWKSAQLGARLFPLLRGELVADRVVLHGADVELIRRADGTANWEGIGSREKPAAASGDPLALRIDGIRVTESRISFVDHVAGTQVRIDAFELSTDEIAPGEPLTDTEIAGVLHMPGFADAGVPFRLEVPKLAAPEDFSSVQVPGFEIELGGLAAEGTVNGRLGDSPDLGGHIETNDFDPRALLASFGIDPPKTTDPRALGRVQFSASWKFAAGAIQLAPITVALDDTKFSGEFTQAAGDDAVGGFTLRGDSLDIARYIPPPDPTSEPFALPTAALKALRLQGTVELEQVVLGDVMMKGTVVRLVFDERGLRSVAQPPAAASP